MPLFSSSAPIPLSSTVAEAMSSAFRVDVIGPQVHKQAMKKIGEEQAYLMSSLERGESPTLIVPCFRGGYEECSS